MTKVKPLPCPFCGAPMTVDHGTLRHADQGKCLIGSYGWDEHVIPKWNQRALPTTQQVGVHLRDEFFAECKRLQRMYGTDAVAPRVEQECGAGAWSFMCAGVLAALTPSPTNEKEEG